MQITEAVAPAHSAQLSGSLHRCSLEIRIWAVQGHCAPHCKTQGPIPSNDHHPTFQGVSHEENFLQLLLECGSVLRALACSIPQGVSLRPQPTEAAGDGMSSCLRLPQKKARKILIHASYPVLCYRCCHQVACFFFFFNFQKEIKQLLLNALWLGVDISDTSQRTVYCHCDLITPLFCSQTC